MNINHGLQAIFIHNPKAAGTSIAVALGMDHGHDTQEQSRRRHDQYWDRYLKFTFVRHPLERLISTYEFALMDKSWYHNNVNPGPDGAHGDAHRDYLKVKDKSLEGCLRMLLDDPRAFAQPGWLPQSHFITEPDELDFVGRYENLKEDWSEVCRELGGDFPLEKINVSRKVADRREYYTPFICEAAARLYRKDFILFGYRLPVPFLPDGVSLAIPKPNVLTHVVHGAVGVAKAVAHVGRANDATIATRTAICEKCEFWEKLPVGHRCNKCGCSGLKLLNASEKCPIGKW